MTQRISTLFLMFVLSAFALAPDARADNGYPYSGMQVVKTKHSFGALWKRLENAIGNNNMGLVGRASASYGAKSRGIKIKGNAVFGVYRNDFAVRMLKASVPAGIEAPLRIYLSENADGSTNLTYRRPSAVFKPYGSPDLDAMALELDKIFAAIAAEAAGRK